MNAFFERKEENSLYICGVMGKIYLKNIRLYAFHGCMDEEEKIGSDYVVNLVVDTDLNRSSKTDDLKDTVDYVALHAIVKAEMEERAKLLEHVADRIINKIMIEFGANFFINKRSRLIFYLIIYNFVKFFRFFC